MSFSALFAAVSGLLGQAVVNVFNIIKIIVLILLSYTFFVAIQTILNLVSLVVLSTFIGEFFTLISMYLPFNANAVFSAIGAVISAILTFFIARKIYNLYKELFAASS